MLRKNKWALLISFFLGILFCLYSFNYSFFDIKYELDLQNLFLGIMGLFVGLYIAENVQKNINRNQNRYSNLHIHIDKAWCSFHNISKILYSSTKIESSTIIKISTDVLHELDYVKAMYKAYSINDISIDALYNELESLEMLFEDVPSVDNVKNFKNEQKIVLESIRKINVFFSNVMKEIEF